MEEQLKEFYDFLRKNNVISDKVDFDSFNTKMQDKAERDKFRTMLTDNKVISDQITPEAFDNKLGFAPKGSGVLDYLMEAGDYALTSLAVQWHSGADASAIDNFNKTANEMATMSDEDIEEITQVIKRQNKLNKKLQDIGEVGTSDDGTIIEGMEKFGDLTMSVIGSFLGMINNTLNEPARNLSIVGGATATGVGIGAVATSPTGLGAAAGAIGGGLIGFKQGVGAAQSIASADIEAANHFIGEIQQYATDKGLNPEKKEDLAKIFSDREFMNKTVANSAARGTVVAGTEALGNQIAPGFGRLTSKFLKPLVKGSVSNAVLRETGASLVEGLAGGAGEVLGSVYIGDQIDWDGAKDEFLAEILPGGAVRGINNAADKIVNKKAHDARKQLLENALDGDIDEFNRGIDASVEAGVITEKQAEVLRGNAEAYSAMAEAAPAELVRNRTDRKEFVELSVEKLSIDEQLSELKGLSNKVDSNLKQDVINRINKLEKAKQKVDKSLKSLTGDDRLSKNPDAEKIHELKTKTVIAANQLGQPLTRADVEVVKGKDGKFRIKVQGQPIDPVLLQTINDVEAPGVIATTEDSASNSRGEVGETSPSTTTSVDEEIKASLFGEETTPTPAPQPITPTPAPQPQLTGFESSTDRTALDGQRVSYLGQEGTFTIENGVPYVTYDDGSRALVESGLNPDLTNLELGIEQVKQPVVAQTDENIGDIGFDQEKNQVTAYGKTFDIQKKRYDANGNLISISARDQEGNTRTIRNKQVLSLLPAGQRQVETTNLVQVAEQTEEQGYSLFDEAEFEIMEDRDEMNQLEQELSDFADLIADEIKTNPAFQDVENSFTEPFDQIGTANDRGIRGPVARKANASVVAKAILDGKGATAKAVRDAIGVETLNTIREKARKWRELSSRLSPAELRKKRSEALSQDRSAKLDAYLEKKYPGIVRKKQMLRDQASTVAKFLPDVAIRIFESPEAFRAATGYDKVGGFYDPETNTIYINPEFANARTIAHEAAHAAFLRLFGQGSRDALLIHQAIRKVLANGNKFEQELGQKLDMFIERYDAGDLGEQDRRAGITVGDLRAEEFFAELTAYLVQSGNKIQKPRLKKLKEYLNKVIKQFTGLTLFDPNDTSIGDIVDFMNDLAGGIRKGTNFYTTFGQLPLDNDITQDDVDNAVRFQKPEVTEAVKRNNYQPMSKTMYGQPSKLYNDILKLPGIDGNEQLADQFKAQVYSDEFKNWFGDWAGVDFSSNVVSLTNKGDLTKETANIVDQLGSINPKTRKYESLRMNSKEDIVKLLDEEINNLRAEKEANIKLEKLESILIDSIGDQIRMSVSEKQGNNLLFTMLEVDDIQKIMNDDSVLNNEGDINLDAITESETFSGSIDPRKFQTFVENNPEYKPVYQDWQKAFQASLGNFDFESQLHVPQLNDLIAAKKELETKDVKFARINTMREQVSKMVDENGEPRIFYHGTPNKFIEAFKTDNPQGFGAYFTEDLDYAKFYAIPFDEVVKKRQGEFGQVLPLFLNIRNPKEFGGKTDLKPTSKQLRSIDQEQLTKYRSENIDGVTFKQVDNDTIYEAVIFNPNQAKSVFNTGGFSPTNGSIRMQKPEGHTYVTGQAEVDFRLSENKKSVGGRIFNDFIPQVRQIAFQYKKDKGLDAADPGIITKLDTEYSKKIGQVFEKLEDRPHDPQVQRAYQAMAEESVEQYKYMLKAGVKVEMFQGQGEPYANAQQMIEDLQNNNHLFVYSTEEGFGEIGITPTYRKNNMLLADSGFKDINGRPMLNNDLFRAVHDYFGHAARGNGFGAIGEENAWDEHVRMFSPLAARAMTAETRGQNSWVNFSGANDGAKAKFKQARKLANEGLTEQANALREEALKEFRFADQKMTIMPVEYSRPPGGLRFHKGDPINPKRKGVLNNLKSNKESLLKIYGDPYTVFAKFKQEFDNVGVTLGDIARVMQDMDPDMNVNDYLREAERILNNATEAMRKAGFTQEQIDANITVFQDVAKRWAQDTGRRPEEFFGQIIADFEFVADPTTLTGDVLFDAGNVNKSIWQRLVDLLPFLQSKKYRDQLKGKKGQTSTPFQEDKALESTPEGVEYLKQNRRLIKGARKITTDGRAIIYITTNADVKTPVHELAHVYEMYMNPLDRKTVLDWTGESEWTTATSERFARGFESFLQTNTLTTKNPALQKAFENFKNWLLDIYNGYVRLGSSVVHLNRPMRELYANMFYSELSDYNKLADIEKQHTKAYTNAKAEGTKFNKAEFDRLIKTHFDNPAVAYQQTTITKLVTEVVRRGLNQPQIAINNAMKAMENMVRTLGETGVADTQLTPTEALGMADAMKTLEAEIDRLNDIFDNNEVKGAALDELLDQREDLRQQVKLLAEVLSTYNSIRGLGLGVLSKLFSSKTFSEAGVEAELNRVNRMRKAKGLTELTEKDKETVRKQSEKIRNLSKELDQLRSKEVERLRMRKLQAANDHIRNLFYIPYFNQIFEDLKNFSAERFDQRQQEILKFIDEYYRKNKIQYDEAVDPYTEFVENIAELVTMVMMANPRVDNIQTLSRLTAGLDPRINENVIADAINILTANHQHVATNINKERANLKKEAKLINELDQMIRGILKPEISQMSTLDKTEEVKKLQEIIASIERLAVENSDNLDNIDLQYALTKLKALEDQYTDFMFGAIKRDEGIMDGGMRPAQLTEGDVLAMVRNMEEYMATRLQLRFENQIEAYERKLEDLQADIDSLNKLSLGEFADNPRALYRELARKYNINSVQVPLPADPDFIKLKRQIAAEKQALTELLNVKTKSKFKTILDETINTPRSLILSADYSYIFYQGGLLTWKGLTTNPIQTLKNIANTIHASFSQAKYDRMVEQFKNANYLDVDGNPVYAYYEASDLGLNVTGIEGTTLEEELQIKSVLERIPFIGKQIFTRMRGFSERGYNSYLVAIRLQEYMKLTQGIESMAAKERIAEYVNTMTGSSKQFFKDQKQNKMFNGLIDNSATFLIAPRLYASVFKSFVELTNIPALSKMATSSDKDMRKMYQRRLFNNLHVLKGQALLLGSMLALTSTFGEPGDEDEMFNIFSANFMKTKFGQTVLAFSPHMLYFRFVARLYAKLHGATFYDVDVGPKKFAELSPADTFWSEFFDTRVNPIYNSSMAVLANRDYRWKRIPEDKQITDRWIGSIAPIPLQGVARNIQEGHWNSLAYEFALDMAGFNSYTVQPMYSTQFQTYLQKQDFTFRIKYPEWMTPDQHMNRARYKAKVQEDFTNEVNKLLEEGLEPSKEGLSEIKSQIQNRVAGEMQ